MKDVDRIHALLKRASATDFSYDHANQAFRVGTREVSIEHAKENHRILFPQEGDSAAADGVNMATTIMGFVMYPRMYDWLHTHLDTALMDDTVDVMKSVYVELRTDIPRAHLQRDTGVFGFSAYRPSEKHPHIGLSVLGHCACMNVSADGMIGQYEWDTKFASFRMHNIDTPEQRVSILAGLGHMAFRAHAR